MCISVRRRTRSRSHLRWRSACRSRVLITVGYINTREQLFSRHMPNVTCMDVADPDFRLSLSRVPLRHRIPSPLRLLSVRVLLTVLHRVSVRICYARLVRGFCTCRSSRRSSYGGRRRGTRSSSRSHAPALMLLLLWSLNLIRMLRVRICTMIMRLRVEVLSRVRAVAVLLVLQVVLSRAHRHGALLYGPWRSGARAPARAVPCWCLPRLGLR